MSGHKELFKNTEEDIHSHNKELRKIDRRTFLKAGFGGAALLLGATINKKLWATIITLPDGNKIVLTHGVVVTDKEICSGCRTCEAVCSNVNSQGRNTSRLARLSVEKDYISCEYEPQICFQCSDPICLNVCPEGAIEIDRDHGTFARVIDEGKCIGCKSCLDACKSRYGTPRPRFDPVKDVCIKCHLCYGDPQCVKFCPLGALKIVRSETGILTGYPFIKE